MGGPHHPGAGGHRAGRHHVDAEHLECGDGTHHVHDGVVSSDFMKMDLLYRPPVQARFGFGQRGKDGQGPLRHPVGQPRLFH